MIAAVLVDRTGRSLDELSTAAHAFTEQGAMVALPYPFGWNIGWSVRVAIDAMPPLPMEWVLELLGSLTEANVLGVHGVTKTGTPYMRVCPSLDALDGVPWTVTAAHELIEAAIDPLLRLSAQDANGTFWALEGADAVERDQYLIAGVPVSNYVLPAYFQPPEDLTGVKLDAMGLVKTPFEIRPGGYGQVWDPAKGWTERVNGQKRAARAAMAASGRASRRAAFVGAIG